MTTSSSIKVKAAARRDIALNVFAARGRTKPNRGGVYLDKARRFPSTTRMADDPLSTTPSPASHGPTSTGLPANVAAALACIPLIGGIVFYLLEKTNGFVRFYAMQSIIFGGAWILFDIVSMIVSSIFSALPALGGALVVLWSLIAALVHLAFLVVFIITVVKAFTNVRWEIPYIGPIARQQTDGPTTI
jgi:uncharacterized membrane protein